MKEEGVSLTAIGLFALVGLPYVLKFTWAPLIDAVHVPGLTRWLGRRRAWLITTQLALIAAIVGLGSIDPVAAPVTTAALALAVTFCSASQDIVVDAFRIESLSEERQAAGMANYVAGYRVALLISTAGMFEIVAIVQAGGMAGSAAWFVGYAIAAALIAIGMVTVLLSDEPDGLDDQTACSQSADHFASGSAFLAAVIDPFREFLQRPMWVGVLLFVMLFKFGDAFAGIMTAPFVLDIGFDKTDYGRIVKVLGFAAVLIGGFAGGYVYRVAGTITSLWIAGLVQMLSNLMFVWQAVAGADYSLLVLTIGVEISPAAWEPSSSLRSFPVSAAIAPTRQPSSPCCRRLPRLAAPCCRRRLDGLPTPLAGLHSLCLRPALRCLDCCCCGGWSAPMRWRLGTLWAQPRQHLDAGLESLATFDHRETVAFDQSFEIAGPEIQAMGRW